MDSLATIPAHAGWLWKIVRLTDSLMASASEDGSVKVWSTESFDRVACLQSPHALRTVRCERFIDAATVATGSEDCRLKIWRARPWRVCYQTQHENYVTDFHAIDPYRGASCSYDGRIAFHDWRIVPLRYHTRP